MDIQQLLGIRIHHGYILQILAAELLYAHVLSRRNNFALRFGGGAVIYALASILLTNVIYRYASGWNSFTIFLLSLAWLSFCFRGELRDILFCGIGAQFTQNLAKNIEDIIRLPFADHFNMAGWFILSVCVTAIVYLVCFKVFAQRLSRTNTVRMTGVGVLGLAVVTGVFVYFMQYSFEVYGIDNLWVTRPPLILCCIFGLCVQFGLLELKNRQAENRELERVIEQERRQYEMTRNSVDIINMKAHDLKHQIIRIRQMKDFDGEELQEIESAISEYEAGFHTGNKALDVMLTEKMLLCHKNNIELSVMADGEAVAFLRPSDLASIFGNLLDNAIEYETSVTEETMRSIALQVSRKNRFVTIHTENYCPEEPKLQDGLPITTKGNKDYHGFGLKSVRYIAQKYGGNLKVNWERKQFIVNVLLPMEAGKNSKE